MIERDLPFTKSVAQRLMQIGSDPRLAKAAHARLLPNAWTTLSELTKLPTPTFERATALRIINPKMTRADAKVINLAITRDTKPIGPVHSITPLSSLSLFAVAQASALARLEKAVADLSAGKIPAGSEAESRIRVAATKLWSLIGHSQLAS